MDGQFFYNGSPWELKARDYAAETLNAAYKELGRLPPRRNQRRREVAKGNAVEVIDAGRKGGIWRWADSLEDAGWEDALQKEEAKEEEEGTEIIPAAASESTIRGSEGHKPPPTVSASDVIAVSAMEGVGVSEVCGRENQELSVECVWEGHMIAV